VAEGHSKERIIRLLNEQKGVAIHSL